MATKQRFRARVGAAALGVVVLAAGGPWTVAPSCTAAAADRRESDNDHKAKTNKALERTLESLHFEEQPLANVLASIGKTVGVKIEAKWDVLERAGVTRALPVTARVRGVTAGKALSVVLDMAGRDRVELKYYVTDDGTVAVTTLANYNGSEADPRGL